MKKISQQPKSFFNVIQNATNSQLAELVLEPGQSTGGPSNLHREAEQWLYVVSGEGEAIVNDEKVKISEGEWLLIESGETHEIINTSEKPLKTFNLYAPKEY